MRLQRQLACVAAAALAGAVVAAERPYDFVACTHTKVVMLEANADFTGYSHETWGVVSTSTTKEWENASTHCLGYSRVVDGKRTANGLCKWTFATGDSAVGEFAITAAGDRKWNWLYGNGKLKGISGTGTFQDVFSAKTVDTGTAQGCRRDWGKFSTPD